MILNHKFQKPVNFVESSKIQSSYQRILTLEGERIHTKTKI